MGSDKISAAVRSRLKAMVRIRHGFEFHSSCVFTIHRSNENNITFSEKNC